MFRHGERVPETNELYPTDEYSIEYFHPMTYGQVTNVSIYRRLREYGEKIT